LVEGQRGHDRSLGGDVADVDDEQPSGIGVDLVCLDQELDPGHLRHPLVRYEQSDLCSTVTQQLQMLETIVRRGNGCDVVVRAVAPLESMA
jgi:hypothetical protein